MDKIIFSDFPPSLLDHFSIIQDKFQSHRLKPQTSSEINKINAVSVLLLDMITFCPLQTPIRGAKCSHFECIDLSSVEFCLGKKCPICEENFDSYEIDEYLLEILSKKKLEGVYINLTTGLYFPFIKKQQKILWDFNTLKFLAIKNSQTLMKSFSYNGEKTGVGNFKIEISFWDEQREKIMEIPCRTILCEHLNCMDLEEMWQRRFCVHCGRIVDETNIYVDLMQYGVFLLAKKKFKKEEIREIGYFEHFPEYECFRIKEEIFNFEFEKVESSIEMEILHRIQRFKEIQQNVEIFVNSKLIKKKKEKDENFNNFLEKFYFPDPAIEPMELNYMDIEFEIKKFLEEEKN